MFKVVQEKLSLVVSGLCNVCMYICITGYLNLGRMFYDKIIGREKDPSCKVHPYLTEIKPSVWIETLFSMSSRF